MMCQGVERICRAYRERPREWYAHLAYGDFATVEFKWMDFENTKRQPTAASCSEFRILIYLDSSRSSSVELCIIQSELPAWYNHNETIAL